MICLNCKHCFHCSTYLIDQDNLDKPVDIKDIQDICKVMGGYKSRHGKQVGKPIKIRDGILKAAKKD